MMKKLGMAAIAMGLLVACAPKQQQSEAETTLSGLKKADFVSEVNGKPTDLYVLKNAKGAEACITNWGGRWVSMMVPDKNGKMIDVVLGYDKLQDYISSTGNFGALIGRYGNRIANGKFTLDGTEYTLPQNDKTNCLHGGPTGWQYQVYEANQTNDSTIVLTMKSADGDNNFPGNVTANVTYTLTSDNAIDIKYDATTDKTTVINMTNHSYFNLSGDMSKPATDHILYVASDSITPVDSTYMTTGEMMAVKDTPFDFNTPKTIAPDVTAFDNEQVKFGNGFDHNWVLNTKGDDTKVAARLTSPISGITLEVYTNEPGIQVYTGNFLTGEVKGKQGIAYPQRASVCLETQHYPDSPNKPQWPSVILKPSETYYSHCIFKFGTEK